MTRQQRPFPTAEAPPKTAVDAAIERARQAIIRTQRADGAWDGACDLGPLCTAQVLIALSYLQQLSAKDAAEGARWLRNRQHKDGSFGGDPFARAGDLGTTATAWAALLLSNEQKDKAAAARARMWIDANKGLDEVVKLVNTGDVAALYLAIAGQLDPKRLPEPPLAWAALSPLVDIAMKKVNFTTVLGAMCMGIIVRQLRGDWGLISRLTVGKAAEVIAAFQNPNGSFNCVTIATAIFSVALQCTGRSEDARRADRGATWLLSRRIYDASGMHFDIFPSDVWTTAYHVRVLLEAGTERTHAAIEKGVEYLLYTQSRTKQPRWNNNKPNAVRTGGWPFEDGNPLMPDPDDSSVVLCALGLAVQKGAAPPLREPLLTKTKEAIELGRRWLLDMQNPDGGWAGFAWGLPGKAPGPAMTAPYTLDMKSLSALFDAFVHPPVILGDPSTEDLTARAVDALLMTGDSERSAPVQRALAFLEKQQCDFGPWWGRWVVNYLAGSSYVLTAFARSGFTKSSAFVDRAIKWTLGKQNDDGGFGEGVDTYKNPAIAGRGATTAPLTGLVLVGLADQGLGQSDEAKRAVSYLLRTQRPDGTWPNGDYLATALPPSAFYTYAPAATYLPLQALVRHAHPLAPPPPLQTRWTDAVLEPMRQKTDPLADELVKTVYANDAEGTVTKLLAKLFKNDDPIPADLPKPLKDYFESTAALPAWADKKQIARAQKLFADYGVQITMGLFCSSLPQAYAAKNGATVLVQTQAMERNTRQRVFETAQFIFDVLDDGAFEPNGKGIRAAQRVRLMHAAIRHLILQRPWAVKVLGLPINQEDMAGTLMTFSAVTFDALRRYGIDASEADGEAWIHCWKVIGHFMGIEPSLMPTSLADAEALMEAIRRRQWAPSPEGRALAAALLEMMNRFFTFDLTALKGFIPTQIRFLAGDHCADLLGIPPSNLQGLLEASTALLHDLDLADHDDLAAKIFGKVAEEGMKAIVLAEREGKQASFRLPESLKRSVIPGT